jgi:hypothetical protein
LVLIACVVVDRLDITVGVLVVIFGKVVVVIVFKSPREVWDKVGRVCARAADARTSCVGIADTGRLGVLHGGGEGGILGRG